MTGGTVLCGFHEVVYTKEVREIILKLQEENKKKPADQQKILWRISSTLFSQIRQNVILKPIESYRNDNSIKNYPPILTKDQVANELKDISLMI